MNETADAIVVGGGVVGASALFHLGGLGLRRVILLERRTPGAGASGASGAFIQFHFCRDEAETWLTRTSMPYFREWSDRVGDGSCGYVEAGYLRLEPVERAEHLRERVAMLQGLGVRTAVVSRDDVARLAPEISPEGVEIAAYEPASGYADANATLAGFLAAAGRRGGTVRSETTVKAIRVEGGRLAGVETERGRMDAPVVVLAAGTGTARLLRDVGLDVPITEALTQWFGFDLPVGCGAPGVTLGDGVSQSYFRPVGTGGRAVLLGLGEGGRRPPAAGDVEPPLPASLVDTAARRLSARLQGAAGATFSGGRSGPVTITPDDRPIVDLHPNLPGLVYFAGDGGSSFKTAPAIGRVLADLSTDSGGRPAELEALRLDRFHPGEPKVGHGRATA